MEDADEMLVRMSHRGGCGCDPASGDGAGEKKCSFSTLCLGNLTKLLSLSLSLVLTAKRNRCLVWNA